MGRLRKAIKEKRRGKLTKVVLLLHDNAPAHTSGVAQVAILDGGFERLNHSAYSSDLIPSDFYLFRLLKKHLRGRRFRDDNELKSTTEDWLESREKIFFKGYPGVGGQME